MIVSFSELAHFGRNYCAAVTLIRIVIKIVLMMILSPEKLLEQGNLSNKWVIPNTLRPYQFNCLFCCNLLRGRVIENR